MIMESGFSSPRTEAFPAGLRVLVVDDDPTWLKILEKMLKKCSYEVTTSGLAREALRLLRDRKDGFDIVISDVNMPDMDGFRLLEHVGLEMDLPVIMMSVDGETSRVMKGVQHGACDYLLKPIRMKELKNIWQHVVRKRLHEVRDIEFIEDTNGTDHSNNGHYGGDQNLPKKRKDAENKHDEKDSNDPSSTKKARVVWTVDLHQKFVKAVNQIGIDSDKVGPKKILDLMNVPWLTRENVASHLQKYRLYLSRIGKEDNLECSFGGVKNSDHSPKESSGSISLQTSSFGHQNDVTSNYLYPGNHLPVQTIDSKPLDKDLKSKTEHRKRFNNENSDPQRASNSQAGLNHSFQSPETSINYASLNSPGSARYPWTGGEVKFHFKPEFKPHAKEKDCFNQPTVAILQQQIQTDLLDPTPHISPGPSISESDNLGLLDVKPLSDMQDGNGIKQLSPMQRALESFCVAKPDALGCQFGMPLHMQNKSSRQDSSSIKKQPPPERPMFSVLSESHLSDRRGVEPNFNETAQIKDQFSVHSESHLSVRHGLEKNLNVTAEIKDQSSTCQDGLIAHSSVNGLGTDIRNQTLGSESAFGLLSEDLMFRWLQGGDGPSKDVGFDYVGLSEFNFPEHVEEVPPPTYVPKFGIEYEYPFDWMEYSVVDHGLLFS